MNLYIFTDIVYSISYFDENLSKVLCDAIYKNLYSKLLVIEKFINLTKWSLEGKWHRLDGPAVERSNGDKR